MSTMKSKSKKVAKKKVKAKTKPKAKAVRKQNTAQKRVAIQKKAEGEFLVTIYLNDQAFEGAGATPLGALQTITVPRQMIKTKVVLTMIHGEKKMEQVIMGMQLHRILASRTAKEIWAKRIEAKLQ